MFKDNKEAVTLVLRIQEGYEPTPEEKQNLGELIKLDLSRTNIRSLDFLRFLPNLQELNLRKTQVVSLDGIQRLTNLQTLYLVETSIDSLDFLSGLTNLEFMDLSGIEIDSLKNIDCLTNLETLTLEGARVKDWDSLRFFINLKALYLKNTSISDLSCISDLTNLTTLDLRYTEISSLESLSELDKLKYLYIAGTTLDHIPRFIVDRFSTFVTNGDWGIGVGVYMRDVVLLEQPLSLFSKRPELIRAYYDEKQAPVNEAKVIFLGDGGVGKTYTIYRIEYGDAPESMETTPGVHISEYSRENNVKINFWDFGGQEIMYSMHRCFLTERTCYVVTVSNRWSDVTKQARRWLKNIESFAPNSKVILAVNRWEGVSVWDLDERRLRQDFPNLVDVVEYTAQDSEDVKKLMEHIEWVVDNMPSVNTKFPLSWKNIMDKLRNMKDDSGKTVNYIEREDYRKICREENLTDPDLFLWLLDWFNDLGVCFSYHKDEMKGKDGKKVSAELPHYMILNPRWLTNAVYIITNNCEEHSNDGCITHKALLKVLNNPKICVASGLCYNVKELEYILEVMRKFQLSYNVNCGTHKTDVSGETFTTNEPLEFVPALCPNVTPPNLRPKKYEKHVRCEVRYDYLPDSVVHRLMVKYFTMYDCDKSWLKGVCIDDRDFSGIFAVCDMGDDDEILDIDVYQVGNSELVEGVVIKERVRKGNTENCFKDVKLPEVFPTSTSPQRLLRSILNSIEVINREFGLKSKTFICPEGKHKASFRLSALLDAWRAGVSKVQYMDDKITYYDVQQLLEQVFDDEEMLRSLKVFLLDRCGLDDQHISDKFGEFLVPVLKNLMNSDVCNATEETGANFEKESEKSENGLTNTSELGEGSKGLLPDTVNEPDERISNLKEELEKFGKALTNTNDLDVDQRSLLSDSIEELMDNLNGLEEKQVKLKIKFKTLCKVFGISPETTFEFASNLQNVTRYLDLKPV